MFKMISWLVILNYLCASWAFFSEDAFSRTSGRMTAENKHLILFLNPSHLLKMKKTKKTMRNKKEGRERVFCSSTETGKGDLLGPGPTDLGRFATGKGGWAQWGWRRMGGGPFTPTWKWLTEGNASRLLELRQSTKSVIFRSWHFQSVQGVVLSSPAHSVFLLIFLLWALHSTQSPWAFFDGDHTNDFTDGCRWDGPSDNTHSWQLSWKASLCPSGRLPTRRQPRWGE